MSSHCIVSGIKIRDREICTHHYRYNVIILIFFDPWWFEPLNADLKGLLQPVLCNYRLQNVHNCLVKLWRFPQSAALLKPTWSFVNYHVLIAR